MTDNEIIKALECCTTNGASCKDCPAFVKVDRSNCKKYFRGALDLINRQKAEIERLKKDSDSLTFNLISARGSGKASVLKIKIDEIKAEAYKEFAERLKEKSWDVPYETKDAHFVQVVDVGDIDNLLKELESDSDAN